MRAVARLLILIPFGIIAGACAAMITIFFLSSLVPEVAQTFVGAILTLWAAVWRAVVEYDNVQTGATIFGRFGSLAALTLMGPVVIAAIIGELARLRGALVYMVLAGALTVLLPFAAVAPQGRSLTPAEGRVIACLFVAGAASGFVFWLIAGRRREKDPPVTSPAS